MLGRLAQLQRSDTNAIEEALLDGSAAARVAISEFGVQGLMSTGE
jgi:hypothetical protein